MARGPQTSGAQAAAGSGSSGPGLRGAAASLPRPHEDPLQVSGPPTSQSPRTTGWLCPYAKRKLGRVLDTGRGPREHEDRDGVMLPQTKEPSVSRNPRRLGAVGWGREEPVRSLRASEGPAPPTPRPCACSPRKGGQIPAVQGAGPQCFPAVPALGKRIGTYEGKRASTRLSPAPGRPSANANAGGTVTQAPCAAHLLQIREGGGRCGWGRGPLGKGKTGHWLPLLGKGIIGPGGRHPRPRPVFVLLHLLLLLGTLGHGPAPMGNGIIDQYVPFCLLLLWGCLTFSHQHLPLDAVFRVL